MWYITQHPADYLKYNYDLVGDKRFFSPLGIFNEIRNNESLFIYLYHFMCINSVANNADWAW